jgi:hypothetical protein
MTGLEIFFLVASTAVSVASTVMQGRAEEEAAKAEARISEQKARISMQQAEDQRKQAEIGRINAGQENAAAQRRALLRREEASRLASSQRAKFANAGIDQWGTASLVVADTEAMGDYNAEMELWQGSERARAHEMEALGAKRQANIEGMNADSYRMGALAQRDSARRIKAGLGLGVAKDVLSGATAIAGKMPTKTTSQTYRWG